MASWEWIVFWVLVTLPFVLNLRRFRWSRRDLGE
jgi:hypothetical protein